MGFGDERGNIDPKYTELSTLIAAQVYADLDVIPGGEAARAQHDQNREMLSKLGAQLLRRLDTQGLIDLEKIAEHYRKTGE